MNDDRLLKSATLFGEVVAVQFFRTLIGCKLKTVTG